MAGREIGVEPGSESGGHFQVPGGVEPLDRPRRGRPPGRGRRWLAMRIVGNRPSIALLGHLVHLELEPHGHELNQDFVVDVIGVHEVQRRHQVGQRADDPQRVAVRHHDPHVGVGPRTATAARRDGRGALTTQRGVGRSATHCSVCRVGACASRGRGLVDAATSRPCRAATLYMPVNMSLEELVGEGEDALGRQQAPVLVHGGEGRDHLVHEPRSRRRTRRPRFRRRGRCGAAPAGGPVVGVARQQLVEEGRARSSQAGHDDRALHRLRQHGGLPLPQVHHAQAVLEDQLELGAHAEAPRQVQQGLGPQRRAQALERLLPPGVAEIVEPGGRAGGPAQVVRVRARPATPRRRRGPSRARPSSPSRGCAAVGPRA